jgi:hypothetical protein
MANKADYLKRAEKLGIKDAEKLSWNDLRSAVSEAEKALEAAGSDSNNPPGDGNSSGTPSAGTQTGDSNDNGGENTETKPEDKPFFEDENGQKYGFTKRTPEKFRFNGVIKSQAEWLKDADAMEMLVYGNSMYIERLN